MTAPISRRARALALALALAAATVPAAAGGYRSGRDGATDALVAKCLGDYPGADVEDCLRAVDPRRALHADIRRLRWSGDCPRGGFEIPGLGLWRNCPGLDEHRRRLR